MRRIFACIMAIILSISLVPGEKMVEASSGLSDETADRFVEMFYGTGNEIASDVKNVLTNSDFDDDKTVESIKSKLIFFTKMISECDEITSDFFANTASILNKAHEVVEFVDNVKTAQEDNNSLKKFVMAAKELCTALDLIGIKTPASLEFALSMSEITIDVSEDVQRQMLLSYTYPNYLQKLEFQVLDGDTNFVKPEEFILDSSMLGNNEDLFISIMYSLYWKYELKYNYNKYFVPSSTADMGNINNITGIVVPESKKYVITFESNCNDVTSVSYVYDTLEDNWYVPDFEREGYVFEGWYWDSACTQSAAGIITINSDKTFYAKWKQRYYTLTFDSNCEFVDSVKVIFDIVNSEDAKQPSMSRPGYFFEGWYWDKECTVSAEGDIVIDSDKTFFAKWIPEFNYTENNNEITITGIAAYEVVDGVADTKIVIPSYIDGKVVNTIGVQSFSFSDITGISIPGSVENIGNLAFAGCDKLTYASIADGVKNIGSGAFYSCDALTSVYLPQSIENLNNFPFGNCNSLTAINIASSNAKYCSVNGVVFDKGQTTIIEYPKGKSSTYSIPYGTKVIGHAAFANCSNLSKVVIPDTVTTIGREAFSDCDGLSGVDIPDSVTKIEQYAFNSCDKLNNVVIPSGVELVDNAAFYQCSGLTGITISEGVKSIGSSVFSYCTNLESVTIPGSVKKISNRTFAGSAKLKYVTLKKGIESIGSSVFEGCTSLQSVTIPNTVTEIGDYAFQTCTSLTIVNIPEEVTNIGESIFRYSDSAVIYGFENSYAQAYADENNIPFSKLLTRISRIGLSGNGAVKIYTTNVPSSAVLYLGLYDGEGKLEELQELPIVDNIADAVVDLNGIKVLKAFLWKKHSLMPIASKKELTIN